jgi:hypothetical protein
MNLVAPMASKAPKNTAALSQLGNLYQYLIALKICLESDGGGLVNIEQYGDLTTTDYNYEIKHHNDPTYVLIDTHIDFWKSLSNWINNRNILSSHSNFILLTSAIVKEDSTFADWNSSNPEVKYQKIKQIYSNIKKSKSKYNTIQSYLNNIFTFNDDYSEKELLDVLNKVSITHSFESACILYENLLGHLAFQFAKKNQVSSLVRSLVGFIVEKGILSPLEWDIEINEFRAFLQEQAKKTLNNEVLDFPDNDLSVDIDIATLEKNFIKKIADIPYPDKINEAAINYTQTQNVLVIMADQNPHALKEFGKQVIEAGRLLNNMKEIICLEVETKNLSKLVKKSKILYNKAGSEIKTGNVPPNIQSGIIHTHLDESSFEWKIKEDDIED